MTNGTSFRLPQRALAIAGSGLFLLALAAWGQTGNVCDLNGDNSVNVIDVQLAVNMALGLAPCNAKVAGAGVCNVVVVQRVTNAALGGPCVADNQGVHSVSLTWTASISTNVVGYYIYRGTASGGPYTRLNSSPVAGTAYVDTSVQAGQTYYYVTTAVDNNNSESVYSNQAAAIIPTP